MSTLAELARIRAEYGLAPVGGVLWLGVSMLPPKRNAIEIDPANLPTALECRAVAGLGVVLIFPGKLARYGALRTLSQRRNVGSGEAGPPRPRAGRRRHGQVAGRTQDCRHRLAAGQAGLDLASW